MQLMAVSQTHVGRQRTNNEDNFLVDVSKKFFAVADGMGGHAAGECASRLAIHTAKCATKAPKIKYDKKFFTQLFARTHVSILDASLQDGRRGMGTTLTCCGIQNDTLHLAHVGDTACYLIRGEKAAKLTRDHVVNGNALTNCLGVSASAYRAIDYVEQPLVTDDIVILASDGLTRYLKGADEAQALRFVMVGIPFEKLADKLVEYALIEGGADNITVIALGVC